MKTFFRFFFILLFGFFLGLIVYNTMYGQRIDRLMKKIENLEADLQDKNIKLENLKEASEKPYIPVLKDIQIIVLEGDSQTFDEIDLEKYIKSLLSSLIGKEINKIDAQLIYKALDRRILRFEDGEYQVDINTVLVTDTLTIYLQLNKQTKP